MTTRVLIGSLSCSTPAITVLVHSASVDFCGNHLSLAHSRQLSMSLDWLMTAAGPMTLVWMHFMVDATARPLINIQKPSAYVPAKLRIMPTARLPPSILAGQTLL